MSTLDLFLIVASASIAISAITYCATAIYRHLFDQSQTRRIIARLIDAA